MGEIIFDPEYSSESRRRLAGPLSAALADWIAATRPRLAGHLAGHPEEKSVIAVHVARTGWKRKDQTSGACSCCTWMPPPISRGVLFVGGETWIRTRLADLEAQLNEQLLAPGTKASVACSK